MNSVAKSLSAAALILGVAAGSYWLGSQRPAASAPTSERQPLYYRNPMGLPDTSPVPKKDPMGMDYLPVYAGEAAASDAAPLEFSPEKIQKLGVRSEAAALRELNQTLRVNGRIEVDERRSYTVAPKFEGWIERLYVNATGQAVTQGQPLFEAYSPELASAQREQALALQGVAALQGADEETRRSMQRLAEASRMRLQNWDVAADALATGSRPRSTFRAPVTGIVLEKKAVQGMRFSPGDALYQIADLSSVWLIADIPEPDIGQVQLGSRADIRIEAFPQHSFSGRVDFIYPTLNSATRTVPVRITIANPQGQLKPAMFGRAELAVGNGRRVLTVPLSAVIDSGTRQIVLVRLAAGRFEPRTIKLGQRSQDYAEVLDGLAAGEQVVTTANFLIDAESNLKAALGGLGAHPAPPPKAATVGHTAQGTLNAVLADGTVSISHEAIASLGWPEMTMNFALAHPSLTTGIAPGSAIRFEFIERKPGEWVITRLQASPPHPHQGH